MKKFLFSIMLLLFLGTFSWGQGTKDSFDIKKSREEQDILCTILSTKLSNFTHQTVGYSMNSSSTFPSNISSFYLAGQGMVFAIPTFTLRNLQSTAYPMGMAYSMPSEFSDKMNLLNKELIARTKELARAQEQLSGVASAQASPNPFTGSGVFAGSGKGEATASTPPVPPTTQDKSLAERIPDLQKAIEKLRANIKTTTQEANKLGEQTLAKNLEEMRPFLIETLATYGDSLTIVKPEEHINFVLITNELEKQKTGFIVISARKSWITDYKAGRLTLDAFKQKVIQYTN
jgi:hypothetical protein